MLRVKVKGHRELVTVVGTLASVSAGEWVTAQGNPGASVAVRDKTYQVEYLV